MTKSKYFSVKFLLSFFAILILIVLATFSIITFTYKYNHVANYSNFQFDNKNVELLSTVTKPKGFLSKNYDEYKIYNLGVLEDETSVSYPYHIDSIAKGTKKEPFSLQRKDAIFLDSNLVLEDILDNKEKTFLYQTLGLDKDGKKLFDEKINLDGSDGNYSERDYYYVVVTDKYKISIEKDNIDENGNSTKEYSKTVEIHIPYLILYYYEHQEGMTKEERESEEIIHEIGTIG